MEDTVEPLSFTTSVASLLERAGLPVDDLSSDTSVNLYGSQEDGRLLGVVGLEPYGEAALLRSLAVEPERRGTGLGTALVRHVESEAAKAGVRELYLLTTTAERFFERLGYRGLPRTEAPTSIASTSEFSSLCPSSSAFMCKAVAQDAPGESNSLLRDQ